MRVATVSLRFAALLASLMIHTACDPAGSQGLPGQDKGSTPRPQHFAYVMSQGSNKILILDTSSDTFTKSLIHADMSGPGGGRFHPSGKRYFAGGRGKFTIWDTTDLGNPVYLKTITPPGTSATGEFRGFLIYNGTAGAIDGNLWVANIADAKVFVYSIADLEGAATPPPAATFDNATHGVDAPHFMQRRPNTNEVWLTNRPVKLGGWILRFAGNTNTQITTPFQKLNTAMGATIGDEPNEFEFNQDGSKAYLGFHGGTITGSPQDIKEVAVLDTTTLALTRIATAAYAGVPGYVDTDFAKGRVYFVTKWAPTVVVFDVATNRILRYIDLGGFGPGYSVNLTPDKKRIYVALGTPAQSAIAVIDAEMLSLVGNITHTELNNPRVVRFPHQ
jgi:DNA-binding beta-propeller fold protein YncE